MDPVEARMRAAIELRELTIALRRGVLSRAHPDESPEAIDDRLREWVLRVEPPTRTNREPRS